MSAAEIGNQLCNLCREGKNMEAVETLYDQNVVSVEAAAMPGMDQVANGIEAVKGKGKWWYDNHEVHSSNIEGPFPHGDDKFAVLFNYDVTFKPASQRRQMKEVGVFTVKNGKVVREEFYYPTGK